MGIGFDAWCAAYGHMRNASMAIGNINANIVNRTTMMCVVDSQCQYPFMVACLLNAVSLPGNTALQMYFNATPSVFCKFIMTGASYPHPGVRSPPARTNFFYVFSCHC